MGCFLFFSPLSFRLLGFISLVDWQHCSITAPDMVLGNQK